ncbi:MAG: class I SAM-dependent methyltransferase [Pseudomonadota bacterium]
MSFSADWLSARRDADHRARNADLAQRLRAHFGNRTKIRVLDLGCGTGANLAMTSTLLPAGQEWTLVDNDPDLLSRVPMLEGVRIKTVDADLATSLEALLAPGFDLVTASALFDLAGKPFLDRLIGGVTSMRAAFFTVLTYDGVETWEPPHPGDEAVLSAFHADQNTDKGLGPAAGPDATDHLWAGFASVGYTVNVGASPWNLNQSSDARLIHMLASGIHGAVGTALGPVADDWYLARQSASHVSIGHQDLLALPA